MVLIYRDRGSIRWGFRVEVGGNTITIAPALPRQWCVGTGTILSVDKGGSRRIGSWECKSY
jgi:hypothetical protein